MKYPVLLLTLFAGFTFASCGPQAVAPLASTGTTLPQADILQTHTGYTLEDVATGLFVPWDLVFTSRNRMLLTERNGRIREIVDGKLNPTPLLTFDEVHQEGETGLLGMALHPDYAHNKYVYVSLVVDGPKLQVLRLKDEGTKLVKDKVIMDNIPTGQYHAGSRLVFDKSGLLYVTAGEGTVKERAQQDSSLAGKVLRMTDEGGLPAGQASYVFAKGLRNSQGLAFLDDSTVFLTDHGPSGFDGPGGGDEFNIGHMGDNFGWPVVDHDKTAPGMVTPFRVYTPAIAPASALLYTGSQFPEWKNSILVGMLAGKGIMQVSLEKTGSSWRITDTQKLPNIDVGRVRALVQGPDGDIYMTTSNRDGRGSINKGDDKVLRLVPR